MTNSHWNSITGNAAFARGCLLAGIATVSAFAVQAEAQISVTPVEPPIDITEIELGDDKPLCIRSRRLASDQAAKQLHVLFEWSDDPTCRVSAISVDAGTGERLAPGSGAASCPPNANLPPDVGERLVTLGINPPLAPGAELARCIADTHDAFWDEEQIIIATVWCDGDGVPSLLGGYFHFQYDITATEPLHVSEALTGQCAPPTQDETEPPPACSDGVDNDEDGAIDYPDDNGCTSPDEDDETAEMACLQNLGRNVKRQFYTELATVQRTELARQLQQKVWETVDTKLRILRYLRCRNVVALPDIEDSVLVEICLQEPIGNGLPEVCPALDCPIDGPGCMDPYPYRQAHVPDEAVTWTSLWAAGFIEQSTLDTELTRFVEDGQLYLDAHVPKKRRHLPTRRLIEY